MKTTNNPLKNKKIVQELIEEMGLNKTLDKMAEKYNENNALEGEITYKTDSGDCIILYFVSKELIEDNE